MLKNIDRIRCENSQIKTRNGRRSMKEFTCVRQLLVESSNDCVDIEIQFSSSYGYDEANPTVTLSMSHR
jgi:hypothetical protein